MSQIDLQRFTEPVEAIMPIVNGYGVYKSRKIWNPNFPDGWYLTRLDSKALVVRLATPLEVHKILKEKMFLRVYALGNEGVPLNFDNFSKRGFNETVIVNFLNLPAFLVAKIVLWEDGRFYYFEEDGMADFNLLHKIKECFDKELPISDLKGLTPELRYMFLLLNLQRQSYREFQELERLKLSQIERDKRIKEFQSTFSGRLQLTVEQAGGKLVKFFKARGGWEVHWKVGKDLVKSIIRDNFSIISLGYCASGADKEHSLSSAIQLAQIFKREEGSLHLTRQ